MAELRFSDLSAARQVFVRQCQHINHGSIVGLVVHDGEPVFAEQTEVLVDLRLDRVDALRPELELADFVVAREVLSFFSELAVIRNGLIRQVEIRGGLPRRLIYRLGLPSCG